MGGSPVELLFMSRKFLSRRHVLRGVLSGSAVALGLPALGAMMNTNGTAFGQTTPIPRRYGVFFHAGGVVNNWNPGSPGPLVLPAHLAPLQRHLASLTTVSGLDCPSFGNFNENRHLMGTAGGLSGYKPSNGAFSNKSLDQIIAEALPQAPRRSLEVGVHPDGTAENGTGWENISHSGANNPNPAEFDPKQVFASLFGDAVLPAPSPGPNRVDDAPLRKSYLDAVMADAKGLQGKLGAADRQKLDAFLDGLREIEAGIESGGPVGGGLSCALPEQPGGGGGDARIENSRSMSKLVAATLACGLTHVFTFMYTLPNAFIQFPGMNDSHHNLGHVPQQSQIGESTKYIMERYAELLDALAAYSEGAGSLLDNCAVLAQSDTSWDHDLGNMLCIIGGKAGGALAGGRHVNSSGPITRAALTLGRACGADLGSVGADDGKTSEAINDILV